jgi:hypothetical protein
MPIQFHGALYGFNDAGASSLFPMDVILSPPAPGQEKATILPPFTAQNSSIVPFINSQPSKLAASGRLTIGNGVTTGQVSADDFVRGKFVLDVPVDLKWDSRTLDGDVSEIYITPEAEEGDAFEEKDGVLVLSGASTQHLRSASLAAKIENHLPVGGKLYIHFCADSSKLFTKPDLVIGPMQIAAAQTNLAGTVTAARTQDMEAVVSEASMPLFYNSSDTKKILFYSYYVQLDGSSGPRTRVYLSDYIRIQALLQMTVRVEDTK